MLEQPYQRLRKASQNNIHHTQRDDGESEGTVRRERMYRDRSVFVLHVT